VQACYDARVAALESRFMSYARSVLQPGEAIVMEGRLHWIGYMPAVVIAAVGVALMAIENLAEVDRTVILLSGGVAFALAAASFARAWFRRWITEFVVTDRRVIYKTGFISRHTSEMNMDKIESVTVDQGLLGRMLDYGTIHVLGTGQGLEHLHRIASPVQLRNAITAR
jgi:uncharacterized membrane protein YdbT with pleckstrin-like domain